MSGAHGATATPDRGPADTGAGPARRPPGRPRSARADRAIVQATLALLVEDGYRALTMEGVRERAGVGKATLYRRYPSKEALVKAAVVHLHADLPPFDTGTLRGDLEALAEAAIGRVATTGMASLMPRLLSEVVDDPEMHAIFSVNLVEPRRRILREILERGQARGELRADLDLELCVDMLAGPIVYRVIVDGGRIDGLPGMPERMLDLLLDGIAAPATR